MSIDRRMPTCALCGVFAVVFTTACALQLAIDTRAQSEEGSVLRIGILGEIDSLNPFIGRNDNAHLLRSLVYDYLICLDEDLQPKPNLATSWCIVDDYEPYGSVWQYNLTHNAYWHDGEKVDANDVVFTFNYQIDEKWVTMWAYQPYTRFVGSVEKVDDYTVRLHFEKDDEPMACSFGDSLMLPILPEHYWENIHYVEASFSHVNPKPLGSGPFMCTDQTYDEYLAGDGITLYANRDYHGGPEYGESVQFDRLILRPYVNSTELLTDFQEGAIDIAQLDAPTYMSLVDWLDGSPSDDIFSYAGLKCTGDSSEIGICMNPAMFSPETNHLRLDPAVRKAMAHATNKESIIDHTYRGLGETGSTIISPIYPYWYWEPTGDEIYEYDLDLANETLDDAGYLWDIYHTVRYAPEGHPWNEYEMDVALQFDMIVKEDMVEDRVTAEYLVEEWAKVGIMIEPIYVDTALWGTIIYGGVYDTMLTSLSGDPDPNYLLYAQTTDALGGWSESWYRNPEYDDNYTASVLETNPQERLQYVENCQRHMYRDNAFIVYAYPHDLFAWRTDTFTGWGDWEAHPGRALSNCWTANDLYFDLAPVDNPPPCTSAEVDGALGENGWYLSSVTVTLNASDDSGSVNRTEYSLDGSAWITYEEPIEIIADGLHDLKYHSVDEKGVAEPHKTLEIAIDTGDPSVHISTEDGTIFASQQIDISWNCTDSGSGVDAVEYSVDGGDYVPCNESHATLTDVEEGNHSFTIRVRDEAGNNASDTIQFSVDVPADDGTQAFVFVAAVAATAAILVAAIMYMIFRRRHGPPPAQQ